MRWIAAALLMLAACGNVSERAQVRLTNQSLCEATEGRAARARELVAAGKLDRARRSLNAADAECPIDAWQLVHLRDEVTQALSDERAVKALLAAASKAPKQARRLYDKVLWRLDAEGRFDVRLRDEVSRVGETTLLSWSPDGGHVYYVEGRSLVRWSLPSDKSSASQSRHPVAVPVGDSVTALVFSDNGQFVAVLSDDHEAVIYESEPSALVEKWRVNNPQLGKVALTNDGSAIVAMEDMTNTTFETWREGKRLRAHTVEDVYNLFTLTVSPDGKRLTGSSLSVTTWDTASWRVVSDIEANIGGTSPFVHPRDGSQAAILVYGMGFVLRRSDGVEFAPGVGGHCGNHAGDVSYIDGTSTVAVRAGFGEFAYVDTRSGHVVPARPRLPATVDRSMHSMQTPAPKGRRMAFVDGTVLSLLDAENGEVERRALSTDGFDVRSFVFSPDGDHIAAIDAAGLNVFEAASGKRVYRSPRAILPEALVAADVSADSTMTVMATASGGVDLWRWRAGQVETHRFDASKHGPVKAIRMLDDATLATEHEASVARWSLAGEELDAAPHDPGRQRVAWLDDALIARLHDGAVALTGSAPEAFTSAVVDEPARGLVSDPGGTALARLQDDGTITITSLADGSEVSTTCTTDTDEGLRVLALSGAREHGSRWLATGAIVKDEGRGDTECARLVHNMWGQACGRVHVCRVGESKPTHTHTLHWGTSETTALVGSFSPTSEDLFVWGPSNYYHFGRKSVGYAVEWFTTGGAKLRHARHVTDGAVLLAYENRLELTRAGAFVARLTRVAGEGRGYAGSAAGATERLGDVPADPLVCVFQPTKGSARVYPTALCEERLVTSGLWLGALRHETM
jgi:WD40 repeat protein